MDTQDQPTFQTDEQRWQAVCARDGAADGSFFYGVTTTGVYCRPTCASRLPKRPHVRFFNSRAEAEQAGFRACKRCQPGVDGAANPHQAGILRACQMLDAAETAPILAELAAEAGLSPFHFQRLFKQTIGVTPRQYFMEKRAGRVRQKLQSSGSVTAAIYDAGFESSGGFYRQAPAALGMKPGEFKNGGKDMLISFAVARSYLGWVLVAATPRGVCAVQFGDSPDALERDLRARFPQARLQPGDAQFNAWVSAVTGYLEAPAGGLDIPLDIQGTAFQRRVWTALREIPGGSTLSYSQVAQRIGSPRAVRAVASACAANQLAVVIPCHRVLRSDGGLGGYRWGLRRKQQLLEREANPEK